MHKHKFVVFKALNGQYPWHCLPVKGGKLVGTMGETYRSIAYTIKRVGVSTKAGLPPKLTPCPITDETA